MKQYSMGKVWEIDEYEGQFAGLSDSELCAEIDKATLEWRRATKEANDLSNKLEGLYAELKGRAK